METEHHASHMDALVEYKDQLLLLARRYLNPILLQRLSPEDLVQDVFARACKREDFFTAEHEVPLYFRLRVLFFQTLTDIQRFHLRSERRDVYREERFQDTRTDVSSAGACLSEIEGEVTGPLTFVARKDQYALLRQALKTLSENDRQIIEMRHFDDMSNEACARVLNLSPKAASIRYVRALERLQGALREFTEFKS